MTIVTYFNRRKHTHMKVFISQAMRGLTDEEILKAREEAIEYANSTIKTTSEDKIEIIDSFFQSAPVDVKPLWYLGKSLELLSTADICLFVGNWKETRGCKIEHECCVQYGIQRFYFD